MSLIGDITQYFNKDLKKLLKHGVDYSVKIEPGKVILSVTHNFLNYGGTLHTMLKSQPDNLNILKVKLIDLLNKHGITTTEVLILSERNLITIYHVNRNIPMINMDLPLYSKISSYLNYEDMNIVDFAFGNVSIPNSFWFQMMVERFPQFIVPKTNPNWCEVYKLLLFLEDDDSDLKIPISIDLNTSVVIKPLEKHFDGLDYLLSQDLAVFEDAITGEYNFLHGLFILFLQKSALKTVEHFFQYIDDVFISGWTKDTLGYKLLISRKDVLRSFFDHIIEDEDFDRDVLFTLLYMDPYLYKTDPEAFLIMYKSIYEENQLLDAYYYLRDGPIYEINYYSDFLDFIKPDIENLDVDLDKISLDAEFEINDISNLSLDAQNVINRKINHYINIIKVINRRFDKFEEK